MSLTAIWGASDGLGDDGGHVGIASSRGFDQWRSFMLMWWCLVATVRTGSGGGDGW